MKRYMSRNAICPFYKHESRQTIGCLGMEENTTIHYAFGNASECLKFKINKCRSAYTDCQIYKMLLKTLGRD